jgi:hypothetical protein
MFKFEHTEDNRIIEDLTIACQRIHNDGLKISPIRIAEYSKLKLRDIESYLTELEIIIEAIE